MDTLDYQSRPARKARFMVRPGPIGCLGAICGPLLYLGLSFLVQFLQDHMPALADFFDWSVGSLLEWVYWPAELAFRALDPKPRGHPGDFLLFAILGLGWSALLGFVCGVVLGLVLRRRARRRSEGDTAQWH